MADPDPPYFTTDLYASGSRIGLTTVICRSTEWINSGRDFYFYYNFRKYGQILKIGSLLNLVTNCSESWN